MALSGLHRSYRNPLPGAGGGASYDGDKNSFLKYWENSKFKPGIHNDGINIPTLGYGLNLTSTAFPAIDSLVRYTLGPLIGAELAALNANLAIISAWKNGTPVIATDYRGIILSAANTLDSVDILRLAGAPIVPDPPGKPPAVPIAEQGLLPAADRLLADFQLTQAQGERLLAATLGVTGGPVIPSFRTYETRLDRQIASKGGDPIADSNERLALLSLYYNGEKLIGQDLVDALDADERGSAWFQIRYNHSNPAQNPDGTYSVVDPPIALGIQGRRAAEGDLFGLLGNDDADDLTALLAALKQIYGNETVLLRGAEILRYDYINYKASNQFGPYDDRLAPATAAWTDELLAGFRPDFIRYGATAPTHEPTVGVRDLLIVAATSASVLGTARSDVVIGLPGSTEIRGEAGNDVLRMFGSEALRIDGGAGIDQLFGAAGNQILIGGIGKDRLTGGPGRDVFLYNDFVESLPGNDTGSRLYVLDAFTADSLDTAIFIVGLTKPSTVPVTFTWRTVDLVGSNLFNPALAGSDYLAQGAINITIPVGHTSVPLAVAIRSGKGREFTETFGVEISGISGAGIDAPTGQPVVEARGHIFADEGVSLFPQVTASSPDAIEGGSVRVVISLGEDLPQQDVTLTWAALGGSATAGSDFGRAAGLSGSLTLSAGQKAAVLEFALPQDIVGETTENFFIDWSISNNAARFIGNQTTYRSTVEIRDDEGSRRDFIADFVAGEDRIDLRAIDANFQTFADDPFVFLATRGAALSLGRLGFITGLGGASTVIRGEMTGDSIADFEIEIAGIVDLTRADFILTDADLAFA